MNATKRNRSSRSIRRAACAKIRSKASRANGLPTQQVTIVVFPRAPAARRVVAGSRRRAGRVAALGCARPVAFDRDADIAARTDAGGRAAAASCWAPRPRRTRSKAAPTTTGPSGRRGAIPTARPHVADGASTARAADSWNLWRSDLAALQLHGRERLPAGRRVEPPRAGARRAGTRPRPRATARCSRGCAPPASRRWSRCTTSRCRPGSRRAAAGTGTGRPRRWPRSPAGPAPRSATSSTGGARSTSRTCWSPRATWRGSGRRASAIRARAALALAALMRAHGLMTRALRAHDRADADGDGHADPRRHRAQPASVRPVLVAPGRRDRRRRRRLVLQRVVPGRGDAGPRPRRAAAGRRHRRAVPARSPAASTTWASTTTRASWSIGHLGGAHALRVAPPSRTARATISAGRSTPRACTGCSPLRAPRLAADRDRDRRRRRARRLARADFLRAHIYAVDRARAEGVDVVGYIYWSLIDNFEWSHGYRGHFGLFTIDFARSDPDPPPDRRRRGVPGGGAQPRHAPLVSRTLRQRPVRLVPR